MKHIHPARSRGVCDVLLGLNPENDLLILDIDSLIAAPSPDDSEQDDRLLAINALREANCRLQGAMLLVTGVGAADIESVFGQVPFAFAAGHGRALCGPGREQELVSCPPMPEPARELLHQYFDHVVGLDVHDDGVSFTVDATRSPALGLFVLGVLNTVMPGLMATHFVMHRGRASTLLPRQLQMPEVMEKVVSLPSYTSRRICFIGDQFCDPQAIAAAHAMGGSGYILTPRTVAPNGIRLSNVNDLILELTAFVHGASEPELPEKRFARG